MKAKYVDQEGKFLPVRGGIVTWSYQFWLLDPPRFPPVQAAPDHSNNGQVQVRQEFPVPEYGHVWKVGDV
jgi:hypothetical protein